MNKTALTLNLISGCFLLSCTGNQVRQQKVLQNSKKLPNIIFILSDDLGIGDLGCYGQKNFNTPNIDRLAEEGILFTNHYTGAPVSAPSRCTLITGLHTGHGTIRQNRSQLDKSRVSLSDSDYTIGMLAREAGYKTAIFGKWGVGEEGTDGVPNKRGFDEFMGYINNDHCEFYYTDHLFENMKVITLEGNKDGRRGQYTHDLFTRSAKEFIKGNQQSPFFIYLAYTIPHKRFEVPVEDSDPFIGKYISDAMESYDSVRSVYAGMITRMDRHIGEIMDLLKDSGIDENTIVFFSSDNGAGVVGKDKLGSDYFNSNSLYRGYKGDLYEGGIHTPLIVRWPGKIKAGSTTGHISAFWDFMPTLAGIAGIDKPKTDGISYLPALLGRPDQEKHKYLYWEYTDNGIASQAVRIDDFKVIVNNGTYSHVEVYNLLEDPGENNDVSGSNPDIVGLGLKYFEEAHTDNPQYPINKSTAE